MRKATLKALLMEVTCPYCDRVVVGPKGEPTWFEDELKELVRCEHCHREMVIPKAAKR